MNRKSGKPGFIAISMIFLCISLFSSSTSIGQKFYGNDWIDYNGRDYYKVRVSKDGFYRIDFNSLNAANLSNNNPDDAHLWFRGKQVPIIIRHNGDNKFDAGEFIEFYGQRNDGTLDSVLYANPAHQPNRDISLFKDTSVYFLTWSATEPKVRINEHPANTTTSISPVPFFIDERSVYFSEEYYNDLPFLPVEDYSSAEYREGEGYLSKRILRGQSREVILNGSALLTNGIRPEIEFLIYGRSDYVSQNNDHRLLVQVRSGSGSFKTLLDTSYNGFKRIYKKYTLEYSDIGEQTYVKITSAGADPDPRVVDVHAVAFIKLRYPRQLNYSGYSQLNFNYQNPNSDSINHFSFSGFGLPGSQTLFLYNKNNGIRTKSFSQGSNFNFTTPNLGNSSYFLFADNEITNVAIGEKINFQRFDYKAGYNYLIVTNKKLLNAVQEFADYKASTKIDSVKNFRPLIATVDQLYDQFFYGLYHPAAIQRFCAYMYNNATEKPQYLLLAGKGYDHASVKNSKNYDRDLVPIIGVPSSDMLYTAGIDNDFQGRDATMDPMMAVGRLSAKDENYIRVYLDKLKSLENAPKEPWQKHTIHISAGDPFNQGQIRNHIDRASAIIKSPFVGSTVWQYNNNENTSVNTKVVEQIQGQINSGASLLTFFGHGSALTLGVDIGHPDQLLQDASSSGKIPFFYINGCKAGVVEADSSAGEGWVFAKNKGAIGWLAHSSTGYTHAIGWQLQQFYNNITGTYYGQSLGTIWRQTIKDLDRNPNLQDELFRNTAFTYNFQGDPSVRLHYRPKPDYAVYDTALFLFPEDAIASSDSIAVRINAYNLGKVTLDSFEVKVQRTFTNGQSHTYEVKKYPPLYNRTTIDFWMGSVAGINPQGLNTIIVTIDPLNKADEEDEMNNTARFTFDLPGNGVRQLFPIEFSISAIDEPELIVQSRNLFDSKTGTYFEIDTNLTFSSPWVKRSPLIPGNNIMKWVPKLMSTDTTVYYWRARLNVDTGFAGEWATSSFTYIKNSPEGWSQSHFQQYSSISSDDMVIDTLNREFRFNPIYSHVTLIAHPFYTAGLGIISEQEAGLTPRVCASSTIVIIEYDKNTLQYKNFFPTCARNSAEFDCASNYVPYRQFNLRAATSTKGNDCTIMYGRDSFVNYVNSIKEGNYVAVITRPGARLQEMFNYDEATLAAFEKLGATQIRNAALSKIDTLAYGLIGRKGAVKGQAIDESLKHIIWPVPAGQDGEIVYMPLVQMEGRNISGSFTSRFIGPAKKWISFHHALKAVETPSSDETSFDVYGVDKLFRNTLIADSVTQNGFNLSNVDAKEYPYLQLVANLKDTLSRTPAQLKSWQVLYEGVPEGTLVIDNDYAFQKDTIIQGDSVSIRLKFRNVSDIAMDSVLVRISIEDAGNRNGISNDQLYPPLPPDSQFTINHKIPTTRLRSGLHRLTVFVNPGYHQPELTLDNNLLRLPVFIKGDAINPVMDVTFDGRHIMDGELVSAKPLILITNKDESRNRILNDTSLFKVTLKKQSDTRPADTIRFSSGLLTFKPGTEANNKASVEFRPQNLEDGIYEMTVQAYDASGNRAGEDDYRISFEVINKSMVSNFFVYPNPFTTKAKFVFTLTGSEIPAMMKVQIMTITGKVVKEITKEELGNLHIGHNLTNYTWDGTDEYGDLLANGLYMYRVVVKNNDGKQLESYQTSADKYFDQNFGKLYIMR